METYECGDRQFAFVIGPPGAGKGSLSKRLASDNDFTHISVGDLLRATVARDNETVVAGFVRRNELLPSALLFPIMADAIFASPDGRPIILDGFPRNRAQAVEFERSFVAPDLVLFFDCAEHLAKERVVNRNDGREGDNSEVFDKRYREYSHLNPEILDYYKGDPVLQEGKVIELDTNGETEASYTKLEEALRTRPEWTVFRGSPACPPPSPSH